MSDCLLNTQYTSVQQRACLFDQTACAKQFCAMVLRGILSPFVSQNVKLTPPNNLCAMCGTNELSTDLSQLTLFFTSDNKSLKGEKVILIQIFSNIHTKSLFVIKCTHLGLNAKELYLILFSLVLRTRLHSPINLELEIHA